MKTIKINLFGIIASIFGVVAIFIWEMPWWIFVFVLLSTWEFELVFKR